VEIYRVEARECFNKGDYECAKTKYKAWELIANGKAEDEIDKIDKCIKIKSTADGYYENKEYEKACTEYKNLLELNPNDSYAEQQKDKCCFVKPPEITSVPNQSIADDQQVTIKREPPGTDQLQLGKRWYEKKDYTQALKYFRRSADQKNPIGQNNLGLMYENGQGIKKNYAEAVKWYKRSAEQGYAIGQYNLGLMYEYGYGVEKNHNEAVKWFKESAKQENQEAIAILKNNEY
jgi:TPR repeat protein